MTKIKFEEIIKKTFTNICVTKDDITTKYNGSEQTIIDKLGFNDEIIFESSCSNNIYKMYHDQDCCEKVYIKQIDGDLNDIINSPIIKAEEVTVAEDNEEDYYFIGKHTFYKIFTVKGDVTIAWYGESNGYYTVQVDFEKLKQKANKMTKIDKKSPTLKYSAELDKMTLAEAQEQFRVALKASRIDKKELGISAIAIAQKSPTLKYSAELNNMTPAEVQEQFRVALKASRGE